MLKKVCKEALKDSAPVCLIDTTADSSQPLLEVKMLLVLGQESLPFLPKALQNLFEGESTYSSERSP